MTKSPPRLATSISTWPRTMSSKATTPVADPEAERARPALGLARRALLGRQRRAAADVARRQLGRLLGRCGRRRAPRACSSRDRPGPRRGAARAAAAYERQPLHLAVRRVRPAGRLAGDLGALVPAQPEPVEPIEDVLLERDGAARLVGVLEPEDERAARVPGVQVVEQRRPRRPDVERPGRARGDPDAVAAVGHRRDGPTPVAGHGTCGTAPGRRPGQDADERRGPQAEGRPAARAFERERVERFGARQDVTWAPGRQRPRLEVREQARVLLGLLGDPVDRRVPAGLDLAEADAGRALARGLGVDRVAVRARLRVAEQLVEPGLDPRRDRALEAHRLLVRFGPAEADDRRQQPLEQRVPPEDRRPRRPGRPG